MKKFLKKTWAKFLTAFGNVKVFKAPLWMVYDPSYFKMTGQKILEVTELLRPGDVVLRGYDCYLDGKFIDMTAGDMKNAKIGKGWSHGAVYVGGNRLIHAVAEGVQEIDVVEFCECDRICVFRPRAYSKSAVGIARKFLAESVPYDFLFDYGSSSLYCFELAALSYPKLEIPTYEVSKFFGLFKKNVYLAKSFEQSRDFSLKFCFNPKYGIDIVC